MHEHGMRNVIRERFVASDRMFLQLREDVFERGRNTPTETPAAQVQKCRSCLIEYSNDQTYGCHNCSECEKNFNLSEHGIRPQNMVEPEKSLESRKCNRSRSR